MEAILESFHAIRIPIVDDIKAKLTMKIDSPKEPVSIKSSSLENPKEHSAVTYINDHIYIISPN